MKTRFDIDKKFVEIMKDRNKFIQIINDYGQNPKKDNVWEWEDAKIKLERLNVWIDTLRWVIE